MSEGFSNEKMLELVLEGIRAANVKIDAMQAQLLDINSNGCAQYSNHSRRLDQLEMWKESATNKFIGMLMSAIIAMGTALYSLFKS